jgi:phage terminase Nu1 subunit (DNA packaging protein)
VKLSELLDRSCSQAEFAEAVGVSEARVSQLVADGVVPRGETAANMLLSYCERLRDQAAGRAGLEVGGLDLVQERAALAREQRIAQELKNAVARGEFAPIGLLADVLGRAASSVVDRFDQLEGGLRKSCPDISDDVMAVVLAVVAAARNEWMRSTARLVDVAIDALQSEPEEAEGDPADALASFAPDDDDGVWEASP